jgi:ATP-binding cassette, subfamily B, multidrug efflux pump
MHDAVRKDTGGWHILGDYLRKHAASYATAITLVALSSALAAIIPKLVGDLSDRFATGTLTLQSAKHTAFLVFLVGGARVVLGWQGRLITAQHGRRLTYDIRDALFRKWETLTPSYYHGHSTGELLSHALSDVDVVRQVATMGINVAINGAFMLGASAWFMIFRMDARLAAAGLFPLLTIPVLIHLFGPRIRRQSAIYQGTLGRMSQTVEEIVGGIRTVKAFRNEALVEERFHRELDELVADRMRFVRLSAVFGALIPLVAALGFVATLWYGGWLLTRGEITLGNLVSFLLYLSLLKQPLEHLGTMLNTVQRASASLSRLADLLDAVPDTVAATQPEAVPASGRVEVRALTFRYPSGDRDVLQDVSFVLEPGRTVGIVGSIGSGKSTLAHLLLRLYEPPVGTVFLDGRDVRDYRLEALRGALSYVPQGGFLFSTSVAENVAFSSDAEPLPAAVERAATLAAIDQDVKRFPDGFATEIGERGVRLSGGQKQRVSIARMIHKEEALVRVLDDSLSAVDTRTERIVLGNLASLRAGTASNLVISHRLSAVMDADEILLLDDGHVAERGTHAELVAIGGTYARLWELQSGEADRSDSVSDISLSSDVLEVLRTEDEAAVNEQLEETA